MWLGFLHASMTLTLMCLEENGDEADDANGLSLLHRLSNVSKWDKILIWII